MYNIVFSRKCNFVYGSNLCSWWIVANILAKKTQPVLYNELKLFYTTCTILFCPIFRNSKLLYFCSFHVCFSGPSKYTANDLRCSTKIYSLMWRTFIHINNFFLDYIGFMHCRLCRYIVDHHIIEFIGTILDFAICKKTSCFRNIFFTLSS